LSVRGKHKTLLAPDPGLDLKTHLLKPRPDLEAAIAFARIDQDGRGRIRSEEW